MKLQMMQMGPPVVELNQMQEFECQMRISEGSDGPVPMSLHNPGQDDSIELEMAPSVKRLWSYNVRLSPGGQIGGRRLFHIRLTFLRKGGGQ